MPKASFVVATTASLLVSVGAASAQAPIASDVAVVRINGPAYRAVGDHGADFGAAELVP